MRVSVRASGASLDVTQKTESVTPPNPARTSVNTPAPLLREADAMAERVAIVHPHYATYRKIFVRSRFSQSAFERWCRVALDGTLCPPQFPEEFDLRSNELMSDRLATRRRRGVAGTRSGASETGSVRMPRTRRGDVRRAERRMGSLRSRAFDWR